jgi:hypothetical protein
MAKDTIRGIAEWWVNEDLAIVEKALVLLEAEGVIEKKSDVYRLKQNPPNETRNSSSP